MPDGETSRVYDYKDWTEGWMANGVFEIDGRQVTFPLVYQSSCMNPFRVQRIHGTDFSSLLIRPFGSSESGKKVKIQDEDARRYASITERSITELKELRRSSVTYLSVDGTHVRILDEGMKIEVQRDRFTHHCYLYDEGETIGFADRHPKRQQF